MAVVRLVWRQTRRRLLSIRAAVWSWSTLLVVAQCSVGLLCGALLVHHLGSFDIIKDRELREQFTSSSSPEQQAQLLLVGVMTAQQFLGGRALEACFFSPSLHF
jgi:hypothetical protein